MKRPNVLFFLADQHRYDCVGCSNMRDVKTPNIDKLATKGVVFNNAFCPTPVCAPARQSLLSGMRAESIGALWNFSFIETNTVQPKDWNIIKGLKEAGYDNTFIGKWDVSKTPAKEYGFDRIHSLGEYNENIKHKYPDVQYKNSWFGEKSPIPYSDSRTKFCADKACDELTSLKDQDKPWFMWIDGVDPHLPCRPAAEFYDMYNPNDIPPWGGFFDRFENKPYIQKQQILNWRLETKTWEDWAPTVACYYAMISQVDHAFGQILDKLQALGMTEDTLIIYSSDHGDMCGSHRMIDKHYVMYDDVLRIPLIMSYPKLFNQNMRNDTFVYNALDIPATLCELCDIEPNPDAQGRSLLQLLKGETVDTEQFPDYTVSSSNGQQFGHFTQRSIRTKEYKYIWNLTDIDEFYDLTKDAFELENKIYDEKYQNIISNLRKLLKKELLRCKDPFVKGGWLTRTLDENIKI